MTNTVSFLICLPLLHSFPAHVFVLILLKDVGVSYYFLILHPGSFVLDISMRWLSESNTYTPRTIGWVRTGIR